MAERLIKILETEKEYDQALERLNEVFDAPSNTPEGQEAELLVLLISEYEDKHYKIDEPHPIEAIKIRMDDLGLKAKDLVEQGVFTKSSASMILNRKRPLTLNMIRKLSEILSLPIETLAQEYELVSLAKQNV